MKADQNREIQLYLKTAREMTTRKPCLICKSESANSALVSFSFEYDFVYYFFFRSKSALALGFDGTLPPPGPSGIFLGYLPKSVPGGPYILL